MKSIPFFLACTVLAFLGGCGPQEEPIRKYKVEIVGGPAPMGKAAGKPIEAKAEGTPMRYLAAIIPVDNGRSWFFKLTGDPAKLEPHSRAFRAFMESITFPKEGGKPLAWKLPAGWKEQPGNAVRFATIELPSEPKPLEMSVTLLGGDLGSNINRWRGELGLRPISVQNDMEFKENVTTIKTDGRDAFLMDMTGKRDAAPDMRMLPNAK